MILLRYAIQHLNKNNWSPIESANKEGKKKTLPSKRNIALKPEGSASSDLIKRTKEFLRFKLCGNIGPFQKGKTFGVSRDRPLVRDRPSASPIQLLLPRNKSRI